MLTCNTEKFFPNFDRKYFFARDLSSILGIMLNDKFIYDSVNKIKIVTPFKIIYTYYFNIYFEKMN